MKCASLNHCKKIKAEPSRMIPQKPTENLELSFIFKENHIIMRFVYEKCSWNLINVSCPLGFRID